VERGAVTRQETVDKAINIIRRIPFTRAIMLTGSMAEGRATAKSDIDFFIQVAPGHIWLTRAWVTLAIDRAGIRRTDTEIAQRICLNWYATFNAPAEQKGRVYKVLWEEPKRPISKRILELFVSALSLLGLEKIAKKIQISRILRDSRTHQKGSQVRYSDQELGFHPPK
jgi:predicted nucleotidyltransferase